MAEPEPRIPTNAKQRISRTAVGQRIKPGGARVSRALATARRSRPLLLNSILFGWKRSADWTRSGRDSPPRRTDVGSADSQGRHLLLTVGNLQISKIPLSAGSAPERDRTLRIAKLQIVHQ